MRRRGKQSILQHVFPTAGEFAFRDDVSSAGHGAAAIACDEHGIAVLDVGGFAERHRLELERLDRPQQAKAAFVIIADHVRGYRSSRVVGNLGGEGLDHEIADRQQKAILIDKDCGALALAAQAVHGPPVGIDVGLHLHDGREEIVDSIVLRECRRAGEKQRKRREDASSRHKASGADMYCAAHECSFDTKRDREPRSMRPIRPRAMILVRTQPH